MIAFNNVVHSVFEAVEDEKYLPIGENVSLEFLDSQMDGCFKNAKAWRSFIYGNFSEHCQPGQYWLNGTCKKSTVKKWCRPLKEYKHLFVAQVGQDKYLPINSDELDFTFTFDCNRFNSRENFTNQVEIYVTASIKQ